MRVFDNALYLTLGFNIGVETIEITRHLISYRHKSVSFGFRETVTVAGVQIWRIW